MPTTATTTNLQPGTVVTGPFYADESLGVGVIAKCGRSLWTQVGEGYVPVRIIQGNRASGGYKADGLTALDELRVR